MEICSPQYGQLKKCSINCLFPLTLPLFAAGYSSTINFPVTRSCPWPMLHCTEHLKSYVPVRARHILLGRLGHEGCS